mmetsp:Transcript_19360/g.58440  ORF Transcript_19360/g.58440 Transcript_19360/m.58440 type:complete len:244 (+) Transcript_19360:41-772(+)
MFAALTLNTRPRFYTRTRTTSHAHTYALLLQQSKGPRLKLLIERRPQCLLFVHPEGHLASGTKVALVTNMVYWRQASPCCDCAHGLINAHSSATSPRNLAIFNAIPSVMLADLAPHPTSPRQRAVPSQRGSQASSGPKPAASECMRSRLVRPLGLAGNRTSIGTRFPLSVPLLNPSIRAHTVSPLFELGALRLLLAKIVLALVVRVVVHVAGLRLVLGGHTLVARRRLKLEILHWFLRNRGWT